MTKGGANLGWPVESLVSCRTAGELPTVGQCEQVAEFLREAQVDSERTGDVVLAHALALAYRICLACGQCRAEVEWHQQACQVADRREGELRQQLHAVLDLINGRDPLEIPQGRERPLIALAVEVGLLGSGRSEPVERLGLWQRVRSLLGWGATPRLPEREAPAGLVVPHKQQDQNLPALVVYCLGLFRVYNNERLIEKWPGHKCKSIFKYMITHRERPIHREILMDLFWRDVDPEAARRNLYQAIYSLRQALQTGGPDLSYILCEESCYRLNPDVELWVDSEAFTLHYQTGQQMEREGCLREAIRAYELAGNLYEGEFLAEDRYEDWPLVQRENLKHAHLDILDRLSQHYFDRAQFAVCSTFCQKILAQDICREDAHRRLMRCYLRQGQRHLALRQYHLCVEALERELDVPPMPATVELYREIQKNPGQFPGA